MLKISFPVGSKVEYAVPTLDLPTTVNQIEAEFEDGNHLFTSRDFELGTVRVASTRALMARLTFKYTYDSEKKIITVCGTDYPSADGMTMMTMPEGMEEETCFEHAAEAGFLADEVYRNGKWNYYSPLMPGAPEKIKAIVRGANDALIAALGEVPGLTIRIRQLLPKLSAEDFQALSFVAHNGKIVEWNPIHAYGPDDELITPFSTFGEVVQLNYNIDFCNVIGSKPDPKIPGYPTWIGLWRAATGGLGNICTSQGFPQHVACSGIIVGGHVIGEQKPRPVYQGSSEVHILPICQGHNGRNDIYMQTRHVNMAVRLNNYLM